METNKLPRNGGNMKSWFWFVVLLVALICVPCVQGAPPSTVDQSVIMITTEHTRICGTGQCCRCEVRDGRGNLVAVGTVCSNGNVMSKCSQQGGQCTQIWAH
jgi:hypothetical protein